MDELGCHPCSTKQTTTHTTRPITKHRSTHCVTSPNQQNPNNNPVEREDERKGDGERRRPTNRHEACHRALIRPSRPSKPKVNQAETLWAQAATGPAASLAITHRRGCCQCPHDHTKSRCQARQHGRRSTLQCNPPSALMKPFTSAHKALSLSMK